MTAQTCEPPDYDHHADLMPPHFLDPDPADSTSCLVCGDVNGYGVLHLTETAAFDDVPDVDPICRRCWHIRHTARCRISLSPNRSVPCGCEVAA